MNFKSLSSVISTHILKEASRSTSGNIRFNTSATYNTGNSRLAKLPDLSDSNAFIWGTTQGVWGKNSISVNYKP